MRGAVCVAARAMPSKQVQELGTWKRTGVSPRLPCVPAVPSLEFPLGERETFGEPTSQFSLVDADCAAVGVKKLPPNMPQLAGGVSPLNGPHEDDNHSLFKVRYG